MADEKQQLDWDKIKKFSKQVSNDIGAAMLGALSYIGDRLGIFSALAQAGAVTSAGLAEKTGLSERYLREWLGAMTAAGYVNYDAAAGTYAMPPEHVEDVEWLHPFKDIIPLVEIQMNTPVNRGGGYTTGARSSSWTGGAGLPRQFCDLAAVTDPGCTGRRIDSARVWRRRSKPAPICLFR